MEKQELWKDLVSQLKKEFSVAIAEEVARSRQENGKGIPLSLLSGLITNSLSNSDGFRHFASSFLNQTEQRNDNETSHSCTSLASSCIQHNLVFLSEPHLEEICKLLSENNDVSKQKALGMLASATSLEPIIQSWSSIEFSLHKCLQLPQLKESTYHLYIKMLASSTPTVVRVAYLSLIKFVSEAISTAIDGSNKESTGNCLQVDLDPSILRLLVGFQRQVAGHWLRYPRPIIEDIVEASFAFLTILSHLDEQKFAVHFTVFGFVDSHWIWLRNWCLGSLSRTLIINNLSSEFVSYLISICSHLEQKALLVIKCGPYVSNPLSAISLVVNFLSTLLCHQQGRSLITDIKDDWPEVVILLIRSFWYLQDLNSDEDVGILYDLCESIWSQDSIIPDEDGSRIITALLQPMLELASLKKVSLFTSLKSLCKFSSKEQGAKALMQCQTFTKVMEWLLQFLLKYYSCEEETKWFFLILNNLASHPRHVQWIVHSSLKSFCQREIDGKQFHNAILEAYHILIFKLASTSLGLQMVEKNSLSLSLLDALPLSCSSYFHPTEISCTCSIATVSLLVRCTLDLDDSIAQKSLAYLAAAIWNMSDVNSFNFGEHQETTIRKAIIAVCCLDLTRFIARIILPNEELWDSLVLANHLSSKIYQSLSEEELYYVSLRTLNILVNSLQVLVYLNSEYCIAQILLDKQLENLASSSGEIIIDKFSYLINLILIKSHILGGPHERILPPCDFGDEKDNWPMIRCLEDIPKVYFNNEHVKMMIDDDTLAIPHFPDNGSGEVLIHIKENLVRKLTESKPSLKFLRYCLLKGFEYLKPDSEASFQFLASLTEPSFLYYPHLSDSERIGVELTMRYCQNLGLHFDLKHLEELVRTWSQKIKGLCHTEYFAIFISTVFMAFSGDPKSAGKALEKCFQSRLSIFVWSPQNSLLRVKMSYWFEVIIKETLPLIDAAFQKSQFPSFIIYQHWSDQCFWNCLDFNDIVAWLVLTTLYGGDYTLYLSAALLKHLQPQILVEAQNDNLFIFLKDHSFQHFKLGEYLDYMKDLSITYHHPIIQDVDQICKFLRD